MKLKLAKSEAWTTKNNNNYNKILQELTADRRAASAETCPSAGDEVKRLRTKILRAVRSARLVGAEAAAGGSSPGLLLAPAPRTATLPSSQTG